MTEFYHKCNEILFASPCFLNEKVRTYRFGFKTNITSTAGCKFFLAPKRSQMLKLIKNVFFSGKTANDVWRILVDKYTI